MGLVEKGYYKGFKLRINNSSKVRYLRLRHRERIIEYNPEFFSRLNFHQEYWMLEWAVRNRLIRDPFQCDLKTRDLYVSKGYPMDEIFRLYSSMRFSSKRIRDARYENLFHGKFEMPVSYPFKKLYFRIIDSLKSWIYVGR